MCIRDRSKPQALKRIQSRLVLEAVAAAENLEATDEELEAEYARMAEQYKMEVDKLKELFSDADKKNIKEDLAIQKAVDLVTLSLIHIFCSGRFHRRRNG